MSRRKPVLDTPLARWGFTALAALAVLTGHAAPALFAGALAAAAWTARRRR
jgi:hypothetical protein